MINYEEVRLPFTTLSGVFLVLRKNARIQSEQSLKPGEPYLQVGGARQPARVSVRVDVPQVRELRRPLDLLEARLERLEQLVRSALRQREAHEREARVGQQQLEVHGHPSEQGVASSARPFISESARRDCFRASDREYTG